MDRLISLYDFLTATRNSVLKSMEKIADFNDQQLKNYYDSKTGELLTIFFKTPEIQSGQPYTTSLEVPLLAISPLSRLGLASVSIAMELWVLKADGVIYVNVPSEKQQNLDTKFTKVNFSIVFNPSKNDDEFSKKLGSIVSEVDNQLVA